MANIVGHVMIIITFCLGRRASLSLSPARTYMTHSSQNSLLSPQSDDNMQQHVQMRDRPRRFRFVCLLLLNYFMTFLVEFKKRKKVG
jgi:hypothetical protein